MPNPLLNVLRTCRTSRQTVYVYLLSIVYVLLTSNGTYSNFISFFLSFGLSSCYVSSTILNTEIDICIICSSFIITLYYELLGQKF